MKSPETIGRIVTRSGRLKQLSLQAERHTVLNGQIRACLPASLAPHVTLANIRDECAILHADSPAWATAVRYKAPEILAMLTQIPEFAGLRSVRVRNAARTVMSEAPSVRREMSTQSAAGIAAQAQTIGDSPLREALLRLAARGKPEP